MRSLRVLIIGATIAVVGAFGVAANANPGPGNSFQCAPGQHDGSGSNANATDHCPPDK